VFLLIALFFGLSVAHMIITPVEMIIDQQSRQGVEPDREEIVKSIVEVGQAVIQWALEDKTVEDGAVGGRSKSSSFEQSFFDRSSVPDRWTKFLIDERPALLSVIFLILIFSMPFLISFLAFNQISGDVQNKGLRYLLPRTERANVFFGRFLGTAVFSTIVMAAIIITITFYLGVKIKIYPAGLLSIWAVHGFLALSILMLPYIAVCSLISASVDSPFLSLVLAKLVIGGVLLSAFVGRLTWKPAVNIKYLLPWGLQNHLLHPDIGHSLAIVLACMGYTAVFLFLGYHRFKTRDL
jgi:ABC-type transport system involved in multi-copper enzyme maturation permease subunit